MRHALLASILMASTGIAQLPPTLLIDDFRADLFGSGGFLDGRSAGRGFPCRWYRVQNNGMHSVENVASEQRFQAGYNNYSNRDNGRVIRGNNRAERTLPHNVTGEIWVSFLMRQTSTVFDTAQVSFTEGNTALGCGAARGYMFGVTPSTGTTFARHCTGQNNYCSGNVVNGPLSGGAPYLVIARITIDAQDSIDVWSNPPLTGGVAGLGTPQASIPTSANGGFAAVYFSTVSIDVGNNARMDALRIAYGDTTSEDKLRAVLTGTFSKYPGNGFDFATDVKVNGTGSLDGNLTATAGDMLSVHVRSLDLSSHCPSSTTTCSPGGTNFLSNPIDGEPFVTFMSFGSPLATQVCHTQPELWFGNPNLLLFMGGVGANANPFFGLSEPGVQISLPVPFGLANQTLVMQSAMIDLPNLCIGFSDASVVQFQ